MFAKALEGVYITLGPEKLLMLNRNRTTYINDSERRVFECAVCDDCGRIAVAGRVINGHLEFANNSHDEDIEYFMLRNKRDAEFNDEEEAEENAEIGKNDFLLCAKCGAIFHESTKESAGQFFMKVLRMTRHVAVEDRIMLMYAKPKRRKFGEPQNARAAPLEISSSFILAMTQRPQFWERRSLKNFLKAKKC